MALHPGAQDFLRVGDVLYGFCGGYFGRDSYDDKRIEAIGADWLVARSTTTGQVVTYTGDQSLLLEYRTEWFECEGCGKRTDDPDLWDPDAATGAILCDRCFGKEAR